MKVKEIQENAKKEMNKYAKIFERTLSYNENEDIENIVDPISFFNFLTGNAQSKSPQVEKFICKFFNLKKVKASENRGDFLNLETNESIELKVSFTNKENKLNLRQIRPYQKVDKYWCIFINEEDIRESRFFELSSTQMKKEIELIGGFTHGTKTVNAKNENNGYSITISVYNEENQNTIRWEQYRSTLEKQLFPLE